MILLTGASQGIGWACARQLLERTAESVLITGRSRDKLDRARAALPYRVRERLHTLTCDQAQRSDVDALITQLEAVDELAGAVLTVGVNPVYTEGPRRIELLDPVTIEATVRTNCTHTLLLTAALLRRMRRQRHGVLVWIGSRAAAMGLLGAGLYCATKSFLSGLARTAHNEYARFGVRVHLVHPGLVRTPRTAAVADAFAARHDLRVADADDVARQVGDLFLEGNPAAVEVGLP